MRHKPGLAGCNERSRYSVTCERSATINVLSTVSLMRWMDVLTTRALSSLTRTSRLRLSMRRKSHHQNLAASLALRLSGNVFCQSFHQLIQARHRSTHDVEVAAVDFFHKARAQSLNSVSAGFVEGLA